MSRFHYLLPKMMVALLVLLPMAGTATAQSADTSFTDEAAGITITWTDEWRLTSEPDTVNGFVVLDRGQGIQIFIVYAKAQDIPLDEMVWLLYEDELVIEDNSANDPPRVAFENEAENTMTTAEAYSLNDGETVVGVFMTTLSMLTDGAIENVQKDIRLNGNPVMTGQPMVDSGDATNLTGGVTVRGTRVAQSDQTPEPTTSTVRTSRNATETPEATSSTVRTKRGTEETPEPTAPASRTSRNATETPEPTASASRTSRTSRTSRNATETPAATEVATLVTTSDMETYEGTLYQYNVEYDRNVWTLDQTFSSDTSDGIRLNGETSVLSIIGWNQYAGDPVVCLNGEVDYYSSDSDHVSGWTPATDANGDPLHYEGDDVAWGVFSYDYTSETSGRTFPLVDYISCTLIPGTDAMLMVLMSSIPEYYNENLDATLDVLDTLQFNSAPTPASVPATPTRTSRSGSSGQSAVQEVITNLDGSLYTSPNYGFTANIPLEWQILDESSSGANDVLVLGNGTSVVTLWATNDYQGDLSGCVDFAANASGLDLQLDTDATGGEFRGTYRSESFANFVYDDNGVNMMYFVNCQPIGDTGDYLILTQDVEYGQFTSERRYRSDIENSIVMP